MIVKIRFCPICGEKLLEEVDYDGGWTECKNCGKMHIEVYLERGGVSHD